MSEAPTGVAPHPSFAELQILRAVRQWEAGQITCETAAISITRGGLIRSTTGLPNVNSGEGTGEVATLEFFGSIPDFLIRASVLAALPGVPPPDTRELIRPMREAPRRWLDVSEGELPTPFAATVSLPDGRRVAVAWGYTDVSGGALEVRASLDNRLLFLDHYAGEFETDPDNVTVLSVTLTDAGRFWAARGGAVISALPANEQMGATPADPNSEGITVTEVAALLRQALGPDSLSIGDARARVSRAIGAGQLASNGRRRNNRRVPVPAARAWIALMRENANDADDDANG